MESKERILRIIENSGLTPSEFADKIGVQRSAISHITSGRNNPSLDFLLKIKNEFPEIDTDWLIFGLEKENEKVEIQDKPISSKTKNDPAPTLFDTDEFVLRDEAPSYYEKSVSQNINRNNKEKKLIKVILFYEDGSFEEFLKKS